jgi:hypothetical protein
VNVVVIAEHVGVVEDHAVEARDHGGGIGDHVARIAEDAGVAVAILAVVAEREDEVSELSRLFGEMVGVVGVPRGELATSAAGSSDHVATVGEHVREIGQRARAGSVLYDFRRLHQIDALPAARP